MNLARRSRSANKDFLIEKIESEEALTLAGSKYVLLELPSSGFQPTR